MAGNGGLQGEGGWEGWREAREREGGRHERRDR